MPYSQLSENRHSGDGDVNVIDCYTDRHTNAQLQHAMRHNITRRHWAAILVIHYATISTTS